MNYIELPVNIRTMLDTVILPLAKTPTPIRKDIRTKPKLRFIYQPISTKRRHSIPVSNLINSLDSPFHKTVQS